MSTGREAITKPRLFISHHKPTTCERIHNPFLLKQPFDDVFELRFRLPYLNLSVDNAKIASTIEIIQQRTIIFGSAIPFNSK